MSAGKPSVQPALVRTLDGTSRSGGG